jgi:hypothetical protein
VGTDDGLVQVSEDGGASWRKIEKFPGVPEMTYVSRLEPSPTDADTVYAAFDNHKNAVHGQWAVTSAPTETNREAYRIASDAFAPVLENLRKLVEVDLKAFEDTLEAIGAPWTPGRVPRWQK